MVITRTPIRVSFVGGGTDLPEYYLNSKSSGKVMSATIDKYIYVALNKKFADNIRVSYSKTENVNNIDDLQHDIIRETMKLYGLTSGWEVVTVADIPGAGSGLGSSSALTVGLLKAISYLTLDYMDRYHIAEKAYYIERELCGHNCGKQDQYAASFGGMNVFEFHGDETVERFPMVNQKTIFAIEDGLILFYLGPRNNKTILKRQAENTTKKMKMLDSMASLVQELYDEIDIYPCELGQYLDINWEYKRQLADGISNSEIQNIYQKALEAGANGGKVLGQGGGGFMLFHAKPEFHQAVKKAVGLKSVPFRFSHCGTEVIYGF